ncbi:MAG: GFA family protein [Gaiellaceae bacterium]
MCGAIRYRVSGELIDPRSCHCSRCRKAFSGAGSAYAEVRQEDFVWVLGQSHLTSYFAREGGWGLGFCDICGSTLCGIYRDRIHGVTLGSVDGDPGVVIERHIFVGSKAPWDEIGGDAPQYREYPEPDS